MRSKVFHKVLFGGLAYFPTQIDKDFVELVFVNTGETDGLGDEGKQNVLIHAIIIRNFGEGVVDHLLLELLITAFDFIVRHFGVQGQRVIYSGDIFDLASYRQLMEAFPDLQSVMLGRGMLRNIFLAEELTAGHPLAEDEKRERFAAFYDDFAQTMVSARGEHGTLSLLKEWWHYFAVFFQLSEEELRGLLRINEYAEFQGRAKEWTKGEMVRI